jgi:hypothetical protein
MCSWNRTGIGFIDTSIAVEEDCDMGIYNGELAASQPKISKRRLVSFVLCDLVTFVVDV